MQCTRENTSAQSSRFIDGHLLLTMSGQINIVVGKFLMKNSYFVIDTTAYQLDGQFAFNMSHTINNLSFGKPYPGMHNPLDGVSKVWQEKKESVMYDYVAKVRIFLQ